MKGNISLKDFIEDVKKELLEASKSESPFFTMDEVELEVSFALDAQAKAGGKFIVFDIGAETKASQMHKIRLKLTPYVKHEENSSKLRVTNPQTSKIQYRPHEIGKSSPRCKLKASTVNFRVRSKKTKTK